MARKRTYIEEMLQGTMDNIMRGELCRGCGEQAPKDDRPHKSDPLCWECHRSIYGIEE